MLTKKSKQFTCISLTSSAVSGILLCEIQNYVKGHGPGLNSKL